MSKLIDDLRNKAKQLKDRMKQKAAKTVEDVVDSTVLAAKDIGEEIKDSAYRTVAKIEEKMEPHQDKIDAARKAVQTGITVVADAAYTAKEKVVEIKNKINNDGIEKVVKDAAENLSKNVSEKAKKVGSSANDYLNRKLEDTIFTNGVYDPVKAKEFGKNAVELTKIYGVKTVEAIKDVVKKGGVEYEAWKARMIPTEEELKTKYAGIGTEHIGRKLFKPDYEHCLEFYALAEKHLPDTKDLKITSFILRDIKASASTSLVDLVRYYDFYKSGDRMAEKVVAKKYLTGPDSKCSAEGHF